MLFNIVLFNKLYSNFVENYKAYAFIVEIIYCVI